MYIAYNGQQYPCAGQRRPNRDTVVFSGVEGLPESVAGELRLCTLTDAPEVPEGEAPAEPVEFELAAYNTGDWLRVVIDGGTLTLTNLPEPEPVPEPEPEPEPDRDYVSDSDALAILMGGAK